MSFKIKDGRGSGGEAEVKNFKLQVKAVIEPELHDVSEEFGLAFSWTNLTYDYAAGDTILLVKNQSDNSLSIDAIIVSSDVATEVIIHIPTAEVTPTGSAVVGFNLNTSSANVAEALAKATETNNTQGDIVSSFRISANNSKTFPLVGSLILPKNKSVGVDFVTNGAACNVSIIGFFD